MDELLRAVLPHEVHRGPAPHQRGSRPMGETEIQTVAISKNCLCALARTVRAARPEPPVSVAGRYPSGGWKYRSRMRREPHVRFREGGGVKVPSATRPVSRRM